MFEVVNYISFPGAFLGIVDRKRSLVEPDFSIVFFWLFFTGLFVGGKKSALARFLVVGTSWWSTLFPWIDFSGARPLPSCSCFLIDR